MKNRKVLYGYQIQDGQYGIHPEEAPVVCRIFSSYTLGLSYQKVSDMLNRDRIPYSPEDFLWNKHKIKRLLENKHYVGDENYPAILDTALYLEVQSIIREKNSSCATKKPLSSEALLPQLRCSHCHGAMGSSFHKAKMLTLCCKQCNTQFSISNEHLYQQVAHQVARYRFQGDVVYESSAELIANTNLLNRSLEQPDALDSVIALILNGASLRYSCCFTKPRAPAEAEISYINVSPDGNITVHFKSEEG
jgi:hypothetical protein